MAKARPHVVMGSHCDHVMDVCVCVIVPTPACAHSRPPSQKWLLTAEELLKAASLKLQITWLCIVVAGELREAGPGGCELATDVPVCCCHQCLPVQHVYCKERDPPEVTITDLWCRLSRDQGNSLFGSRLKDELKVNALCTSLPLVHASTRAVFARSDGGCLEAWPTYFAVEGDTVTLARRHQIPGETEVLAALTLLGVGRRLCLRVAVS
eukprot:2102861-Amphidinium_carterae.1